MSAAVKEIRVVKNSLYIEPISVCNLHCRMCYANVINGEGKLIRPANQILDFIRRVLAGTDEQVSAYWCGTGEIFLHRDFPRMVNELMADFPEERLTQTIQTNGMVRRLKELEYIQRLGFNVSIDGPREFHEWHRGKNTYDALFEACRERARPIVMTTVAMSAGMLPTALGIGEGAGFRQPMAVAVIGGLISSTVLSLVLVPVVYSIVDAFERWLNPLASKLATARTAEDRQLLKPGSHPQGD